MHRHSREDEYTFVLEGRVGALLGEEEVYADPGNLIFKPRAQWHTFWNAGEVPARMLETISPAGFENAFREIDGGPEQIAEIATRQGVEVDFERTMPTMYLLMTTAVLGPCAAFGNAVAVTPRRSPRKPCQAPRAAARPACRR